MPTHTHTENAKQERGTTAAKAATSKWRRDSVIKTCADAFWNVHIAAILSQVVNDICIYKASVLVFLLCIMSLHPIPALGVPLHYHRKLEYPKPCKPYKPYIDPKPYTLNPTINLINPIINIHIYIYTYINPVNPIYKPYIKPYINPINLINPKNPIL